MRCDGLSPYLGDVGSAQFPGLPDALSRDVRRPEPAVAGGVPQETFFGVRGPDDDALAWVRLHHAPVGCPVLVIHSGDEGFHGFCLGLAHSRQFGNFDDQVALQLLRSSLVFHIRHGERVRKPVSGELREQCALADALRPYEDEYVVELCARPVNPRDCRDQRLADHRAVVCSVGGAQVVNEERV